MAARVGLSRDDVVAEAIVVLDEVGAPSQVTMAGVAQRLGVRTQSLYAHVDNAEELARSIALVGLAELAAAVTEAAVGRSGPSALQAMVRAQLDFALDRTGLFCASLRPPGDDPELRDATGAVVAPFERVLGDMGVAGAAAVHWTRHHALGGLRPGVVAARRPAHRCRRGRRDRGPTRRGAGRFGPGTSTRPMIDPDGPLDRCVSTLMPAPFDLDRAQLSSILDARRRLVCAHVAQPGTGPALPISE